MTVPPWQPGDNVRASAVREVVGGKGNNVARALRRLGRPARSVTFLGGAVGERCRTLLRAETAIEPIVISTAAPTREIVTLRAPGIADTAFFDPDPAITADEADALLRQVDAALAQGEVAALTLSGSSPAAPTHGVYRDLIALGQGRRVPVFLDTYGPALAAIGGFWPDVISLNRREAGLLLGDEEPTAEALERLLAQWSRRGVRVAVVTDGPRAVRARIDGQPYLARPPAIEAVNPIGSGDCLLAGLVDAYLGGFDPAPLLRRAVATATANALVWDAGAVDPAEVGRLEAEVHVEAHPRADR